MFTVIDTYEDQSKTFIETSLLEDAFDLFSTSLNHTKILVSRVMETSDGGRFCSCIFFHFKRERALTLLSLHEIVIASSI